jgi:hypothetical protein
VDVHEQWIWKKQRDAISIGRLKQTCYDKGKEGRGALLCVGCAEKGCVEVA